MALINPELIGLARIKIVTGGVDTPVIASATYDYANGFDVSEVAGALPGAPVIRVAANGTDFDIFLSNPQQPGTALAAPATLPSHGGVKATFNIVRVSTPTDPSPSGVNANTKIVDWQYGDYALVAPYAKVNPQKAIKVFTKVGKNDETYYIDVSVFSNPMTLYK